MWVRLCEQQNHYSLPLNKVRKYIDHIGLCTRGATNDDTVNVFCERLKGIIIKTLHHYTILEPEYETWNFKPL